MNYPAMEGGGFDKPPQACLPWPGQWGCITGTVLILRGIFPRFMGCYETSGFGSGLASSRMHPRADRRDFPITWHVCPHHPKEQRVPAGQDAFKLSPNCQPKSYVSVRKGSDMVSSVPTCPSGCS